MRANLNICTIRELSQHNAQRPGCLTGMKRLKLEEAIRKQERGKNGQSIHLGKTPQDR